MIDLKTYLYSHENVYSLPEKLNERTFLKTELDIVYSDFANWERNDLLYIKDEESKGNWKKLNYIEYTWTCMVHELLLFGFTYAEIRDLKIHLFNNISVNEVRKSIRNADNDDSFIKSTNELFDAIDNNPMSEKKLSGLAMSMLQLIVVEIVVTGDDYFLYFFKNSDYPFVSWSNSAIEGYRLGGNYEFIQEKIKESHFVLSVGNIVSKFLIRDGVNSQITQYILTKEEYTILKMIRKDYKNIKSVNIRFGNGKMDRMEITTLKKASTESRIIDYIKKGDYQKITIDTEDGRIVNFENTQKIKL